MAEEMSTVFVVGATGSIGRLVAADALDAGYQTRALVRDPARAGRLPEGAEVVVGDLTDPGTLREAVAASPASCLLMAATATRVRRRWWTTAQSATC
jgi:nucleoside-diphosphate-sugar epimerase